MKHLAANCRFDKMLEEMLRDRFIFGMTNCRALEKLFQESEETLTLAKALEIVQNMEAAANYQGERSQPRGLRDAIMVKRQPEDAEMLLRMQAGWAKGVGNKRKGRTGRGKGFGGLGEGC